MRYSASSLFLLLLSVAVPLSGAADEAIAASKLAPEVEWFKKLDENHDGHLDQTEFSKGFAQLRGWRWPLSSSSSATTTKGGFWKAFSSSFAMIVATEIGDKTFFIAAIMSMKHDRLAVFSGAISALIIMTILSTAMGLILPAFVDRKYTHLLGAVLFCYFGVLLLKEGKDMEAGKASDELEEVEGELMQNNKKADDENGDETDQTDADGEDVEEGKTSTRRRKKEGVGNTKRVRRKQQPQHWLPITLQALSLTFFAEWGDRSQIATIALAASRDGYGVTAGGILGHSLCTGVAVLGGRILAASISERTVHLAGGTLFLLFGVHALLFEE